MQTRNPAHVRIPNRRASPHPKKLNMNLLILNCIKSQRNQAVVISRPVAPSAFQRSRRNRKYDKEVGTGRENLKRWWKCTRCRLVFYNSVFVLPRLYRPDWIPSNSDICISVALQIWIKSTGQSEIHISYHVPGNCLLQFLRVHSSCWGKDVVAPLFKIYGGCRRWALKWSWYISKMTFPKDNYETLSMGFSLNGIKQGALLARKLDESIFGPEAGEHRILYKSH